MYWSILPPYSNPLLENWFPGGTWIFSYLITLCQSVSEELIPWVYLQYKVICLSTLFHPLLENWLPGNTYVMTYLITLFQSVSGELIPWEYIFIVLSYHPVPICFWRMDSQGVLIYCPILSPYANPFLKNWFPGFTYSIYVVICLTTLFEPDSGELIPWGVHIYCPILLPYVNPFLKNWFPGCTYSI
jgi:hypothetical protein